MSIETRVSICILTYNRCNVLRALLSNLSELTFQDIEIIIVDNNSSDGTQEMINTEFTHVMYIRNQDNVGVVARNYGCMVASGDYIITLDDDVIGIGDKDIEYLINAFSKDQMIAAITFRLLDINKDVCNWVHHCDSNIWANKEFETYEITEGAVAFRKTAISLVGYYDDRYFISHEGPDLVLRLMDRGFKVIYTNQVEVIHLFDHSGREPWRIYYYDTRNHIWLAIKNFPIGYLCKYLFRSLLANFLYSVRDRHLFYWLKAIYDGILGGKTACSDRNVLKPITMKKIKLLKARDRSFKELFIERVLKKKFV